MQEYPLYQHFNLCPTARYVGGVSKYLCECPKPQECEGVKAVRADNRPAQFTNAPAGYEGIAWGIEEMHKQNLDINATTLHTFLREHDLMYGIECIQLYLSERG